MNRGVCKLGSVTDRQTKLRSAAETHGPRCANHDLGADVRLAPAAFVQDAVRQTDSENDQQHANRSAENTDCGARRSMSDV